MTGVVNQYNKTKRKLSEHAPAFLFALLLAQPLLDIISYWANEWDSTAITTLVRFGMFAMVMAYCYIISDRKWVYIAGSAVMLAYWILHMIACFRAEGGYVDILGDMNNFFRTVHLPYFTFAFITIFKKSDIVPKYVQIAFCINMVIMMHALLISYMTGTQIYTYGDRGLMSWASVHNSQSAILAFVVPLMLFYAYKKRNKVMYYIIAVICFANLFFVGTKVDYYAIFIIAIGMMLLLLITGENDLFYYSVLFLAALICALCYSQSIAFNIKVNHITSMDERQEYVNDQVENVLDPIDTIVTEPIIDTIAPDDTELPEDSSNPNSPDDPANTGEPEDPDDTGNPENPEDTGDPEDTGEPIDPDDTGDPEDPSDTGDPEDTGDTDTPDSPEDPGTQKDPDDPGTPINPADPKFPIVSEGMTWDYFCSLNPKGQYEVRQVYGVYLGPMIQKFGFKRVFERYGGTLDVTTLTAVRPMKVNFAELAFEDANLMTRLFGYEYKTLIYDYTRTNSHGQVVTTQHIYDLENDFPSIFYYGGYVGFVVYMIFLLYFIGLIVVAVITRFKKCITVENGLLAITYVLMLGCSQFSGNVLRRPNASIYMSVILAYLYYVTVIKENVHYRDLFRIFKRKKKS